MQALQGARGVLHEGADISIKTSSRVSSAKSACSGRGESSARSCSSTGGEGGELYCGRREDMPAASLDLSLEKRLPVKLMVCSRQGSGGQAEVYLGISMFESRSREVAVGLMLTRERGG